MLDSLVGLLRIKLILHWLIIYIVVNIIEFIVMKLIFGWMFGPKEQEEPVK
jgi:hypothetical protein